MLRVVPRPVTPVQVEHPTTDHWTQCILMFHQGCSGRGERPFCPLPEALADRAREEAVIRALPGSKGLKRPRICQRSGPAGPRLGVGIH